MTMYQLSLRGELLRRWPIILLMVVASFTVLAARVASGEVTVEELRTEYRCNPLGIDAQRPRLSWVMQSDSRGDHQAAYQLLVASDQEKLDRDEGNRWDSGRVESDQSFHVQYQGVPLSSHAECYWKVRVWDKDGNPSPWSQPAHWSMGILEDHHWQAQWIGLDEEKVVCHISGTNWIWFPEGNPAKSAPIGERFFRRAFTLPSDRAIKNATFRYTADDRCTMFVNGRDVGGRSGPSSTKEMDLTHRLHSGRNVIAAIAHNEGTEPNPAGLIAWLRVDFDEGEPLILISDEKWKAHNQQEEGWHEPEFDDAHWQDAQNLGGVGMAPWYDVRYAEERRLPARYLRKEFVLDDKEIKRAMVYFSGLGLSQMYINGDRIGDQVLSPGLTEYPKRVFYITHDVTDALVRGNNALGVILGNGRYYAPRSEVYAAMPTYGYPKLLLHLRVDYVDGTFTQIVSDESWKLSTNGPILANNEYDGEEYDARNELGDWTNPGFNDSAFQLAELAEVPTGQVVAEPIEPIRVTETVKPIEVSEPKPRVFVFDLGQNMVGWVRIKMEGPAGTEVTLRHSETLNPDGTLFLANIRGAKATDKYTLKGGGVEVWEPQFTYHGFRYVEVTGYPGTPTLKSIEGRVVHDDLRRTGTFECSHPLLNQILKNADWGFRGNYRSIPTDCPQRDERQAWLGDRIEIPRGEAYLYDTAAFYAKWVQDMADAQKKSGSVPDVAPAHWPTYTDNVVWPSSTIFVPNTQYRQYADRQLLASHYESAKRWMDYMQQFVEEGLISRDQYGDWCMPPEDPNLIHSQDPSRQTDKTLLASSFFYRNLRLMERFARILEKKGDAEQFAQLADEMKAAFNAKFLNRTDGKYDNGTQTSSVLPLAFGLVPDDQIERVFDHLVTKISEDFGGHIGTGLVGGQFLLRVLTDHGRPDMALTIATQETYPSWGYMISQGATTFWELWNGDTADPAMNSHNHVMLVGDYVIWLFENLAGIKPDIDAPGFKHIVMRPEPVEGLDYVKASFDSPHGRIASHWKKSGDVFDWQITVPANTKATVYVPSQAGATITEGDVPADDAAGVKFLREEAGYTVYHVGGGNYHFESR